MRLSLMPYVLVLFVIGGCASYAPTAKPMIPKDLTTSESQDGTVVAVGADAYVQADRQKAVFDADFNKVGVIPVQVVVKNQGERRILVRQSDIKLVLADGTQIASASTTELITKLEKSNSHFWAMFFFGLPGFLVAENANDKARADRQTDYHARGFEDATLVKGDSVNGFVYFVPPAGTPAFTQAILTLRCVDTERASSILVNVPLTDLAFKPTK